MAPKIVLITGCSTGIGLDTAVLLANDKGKRFKVFATMRNLAKKGDLEKAAGSTFNKTLFIRELDVTKEESKNALIKKLNKEEGGVDILVNNAGRGHTALVTEDVPMDEITNLFNTNVFGLIRLTQAVIPTMKAKRSGHIINISSMAGLTGFALGEFYCASKFAVEGFSEALAPLLQQFNIRLSLIEPGPVQTKFVDNTGIPTELPKTDQKTQELIQTSMGKINDLYGASQQSTEISEVIKKVILTEKPQLRYQTSEALVKQASMKYVDPTGDSMVKGIAQMNGWAQ